MSLWKRGGRYWTDFTVDGMRFRKPLRTADRNVAKERERNMIETARRGRLSDREAGPRYLSQAVAVYLDAKRMRCSARTIELEKERLEHRQEALRRRPPDGDHRRTDCRVPAQPPRRRHREPDHQHGRRRAIARAQVVRALAAHSRTRCETCPSVSVLSAARSRRRSADDSSTLRPRIPNGSTCYCAAVVAANTSMRPVEVKHLRRRDVDLVKKLVHVRRSKNESSHRVIPLNAPAIERDRADARPRRSAWATPSSIISSGRPASGAATTPRSRC